MSQRNAPNNSAMEAPSFRVGSHQFTATLGVGGKDMPGTSIPDFLDLVKIVTKKYGKRFEYIFECYPSGPVERRILHNTRLDGTDRFFDIEDRRELRQV